MFVRNNHGFDTSKYLLGKCSKPYKVWYVVFWSYHGRMNELTVDLSCDHIAFNPSSLNLAQANYIYGKNGTGKSTIAKLLEQQFKQEYTVLKFSGFGQFLSVDEDLNAISLGKENAKIQEEIKNIDTQIDRKRSKREFFRILVKRRSLILMMRKKYWKACIQLELLMLKI